MLELICLDPASDPRWGALLDRYESSLFHSPAWVRVLQETYGLPIRAYVLGGADEAPLSGISFCRIEDITGVRIATMPFSDYCDPLVAEQAHWDLLAEQLCREDYPLVMRCLRNDLPLEDWRFTFYSRAKWHGVDLEPTAERLWQRVDEASRRAIRKARGAGVVVRPAESRDELRRFFELHLRIRKYKYRLLAQPYTLFEQIWEQFVEQHNGCLMLALHDQKIIGGIYLLGWQETIYYKFNASDATNLVHRPNDLLVWESMLYAKELGYRLLDFGLTDWDQEGLLRYKRKFATDERTISFLRYTPDRPALPQADQVRRLLPELTDLFTEPSVPDALTERAGDLLYKFFC